MKKAISILLIVCMALTLLVGCGTTAESTPAASDAAPAQDAAAPEKTYSFKMGHSQAVDHPFNDTCEYFAALVNEKTGGVVTIDIFPNSQLGDEATMMESLSMGSLDFLMANGANTAALVPELGLMGVCYLFDSEEHLVKVTEDEEIFSMFNSKIDEKGLGIKLLNLMGNGTRNLYTNAPVESLEDLKGMKIRVMPSAVDTLVWNTLGATATTVAFSEVYSALQTNLIDGAENTFSSYAASKHYEVAPYVTETHHQWLVTELWASEKALSQLPQEYVDAIYEAAQETASYSLQHQLEVDAAYCEQLKESGVTFIEVDIEPWKALILPLHEQIAADLGCTEILARINELR